MRPCANEVRQIMCVFILLSIVPTTLQDNGKRKPYRQGKNKWEITQVESCSPERCLYICTKMKNFYEEGVEEARCVGTQCLCKYKKICSVSDCHQKCAREKFAQLSKKKACFTKECFCLYKNRCEKRNCVEGCPGVRPQSDGVKGVCVGSGCSCRWT